MYTVHNQWNCLPLQTHSFLLHRCFKQRRQFSIDYLKCLVCYVQRVITYCYMCSSWCCSRWLLQIYHTCHIPSILPVWIVVALLFLFLTLYFSLCCLSLPFFPHSFHFHMAMQEPKCSMAWLTIQTIFGGSAILSINYKHSMTYG